jgi:hypothetical protein
MTAGQYDILYEKVKVYITDYTELNWEEREEDEDEDEY